MIKAIFLFTISVTGFAQVGAPASAAGAAQKNPTFEVAAIKQHKFAAGRGGGIGITGSLVMVSNMSLRNLIINIYDLKAYQLEGGPSWVDGQGGEIWFDITAKVEGDVTPTREQANKMLQSLVEARFQLKLRRETRDTASYSLVVGKSGAKFKPSAPDAVFRTSTSSGKMMGTKVTMATLARVLASRVEKPVIDKTGLTGEYDVTLESPDMGFVPPAGLGATADDSKGPSLFTAVEEQLGLRMVTEKNSVEYFVIEQVEKPSDN